MDGEDFTRATLTVIGGMLFGFVLIIYLSNKIGSKGIFKRLALDTTLDNKEGYLGVPRAQSVVGGIAIASTVLRLLVKYVLAIKFMMPFPVNGAFIEKELKLKL